MRPLSLTVENYLKEILLLQAPSGGGAGSPVATGLIARALGVAPATVTAMLKALEEAGLVKYRPYGGVQLTREGEALALRVQRRHRVIELFLVEVLGMPWTEVHEEAEALEHAVSEKVLERMDLLLGRPTADPHGDPIPRADGEMLEGPFASLSAARPGERVVVVRVLEQGAEFLRRAERLGLRPGSAVEVLGRDEAGGVLRIAAGKRRGAVAIALAEKVRVRPAGGALPPPSSPLPSRSRSRARRSGSR